MRERKGLRFEVYRHPVDDDGLTFYDWHLVGAGNVSVAISPEKYQSEKEARSAVASAKKRFKASGMIKVLTVDLESGTVLE